MSLPVILRNGFPYGDKDCETNEELNYDQIIIAVLENNGEKTVNEDLEGDANQPPARILHTDAKNAFDIALQYIKQNSTRIQKLRNIAAKSRISFAK